jgi:hypothetical protein
VANGAAAAVDPSSVVLEMSRGTLRPDPAFTPRLDDADGDGNADLTLKFDRAAFQDLLPPPSEDGTPVVAGATARWQFADGTPGFASAVVRVVE